jgi:two-component system chemotaxis response regulator CheB
MAALKVLIVDDSRILRSALEQALAAAADEFQVTGSVWSGAKALEKIAADPPDVVTLDLELPPGVSGLDTLDAIRQVNAGRPGNPIGVLVVSAHAPPGSELAREARAGGAFDCLLKPAGASVEANVQWLQQTVLGRLRAFAARRSGPRSGTCFPACKPAAGKRYRAVVIAVSTGGPETLAELLPELCSGIDVPIFIVQHMGGNCMGSLVSLLAVRCRPYTVVEAADGRTVEPRTVYLAPCFRHLLLRTAFGDQVVTGLSDAPAENNCRPSADVLFRTAAAVYGGDVVALVLTGMADDGVKGLGPLKRAGAFVIAQDEATSKVWGMPGRAVASGQVDAVLPLPAIAAAVKGLVLGTRKP